MKIRYILKLFMGLFMFVFLHAEDIQMPKHEIHFLGQVHFDEAALQDAMGVESKSFFEFWKDDKPTLPDKLRPNLEQALKSFYDSEGFYDANFTIEDSNISIIVHIDENTPIKVKDINITSDYNLSSLVQFKKDDIFRAKTFVTSKNKIISALLKDGYCSYDLDTKAYVDLDKHIVDLQYNLRKGGVCTFGKLSISGLETIDEEIVKSRVRTLEGERFSVELVQETSNNLYGLNAFDSVLIDVDKKIYNVIPVDIVFSEMEKPYHTEVGGGYDSYVGMRVHGEITKHNFLGNAQKLALKALWSQKEQLLVLSYKKPAFLNLLDYNIDLGGNLGYSNLEFDGFQEEKSFIRAYLEHENGRLKLRAGLALEDINIQALDNLDSGDELTEAVTEGDFALFYPYVDFVYDARDSKLNPKYGYYLAAYAEFGLSSDEESSVYLKTLLEARLIHTFSNLTLAVVGKVGVIDEESDKGLPESKYFFAGGAYSNRAYGYRELGVIISPTEDSINGASTMLNLSFEADYPVWGDLYGAVFSDNTMLTEESYDFKGEIISSAGLGLRYMTPIGPFKFDIAFNVNDPSIHGFQFQIGQSF